MWRRSSSWIAAVLLAGGGLVLADAAPAQGWKPERNVELTIPSGPGGSNDIAGRIIQKLWADLNLLPVSSAVVNRAGGGHLVAYTYVQQRSGDPHMLGVMSTPLLMNHVEGRTPLSYNDLTPIAYLITEPMVAVVRADSPIKTAKDLLETLKTNPNALSIALTSTGHRVSVGMPMQKAGVNVKAVRTVVFKSGGETTNAVLGGHADVQITSVSTSVPQVSAGTMRALAVSSDQRLGGVMAQVPTWQELGYQSSGSWKGVMAPKGITPAQVAFWEDVMRKTAQSDDIRQYAEKNLWLVEFKGAADTRKWMQEQSASLKAVLGGLGLIKQ
ncbi:MAG: tripartite tricarboxylate transporter substrate binding protein [Betaproteobacteria bacterium]|nr:tripartite tricarboxylate transporter substrate binding protein [Betaproteobacteria bacterium]